MYGKPCSVGVAAIVLFATIVTAHTDGPSAGCALPYGSAEFKTVAAPIQAQDRSFDLLTSSVTDIQQAVAADALTYEKLVQLYLNRIEAYNKKGPQLNAVIAINPHALETARALDTERLTKGPPAALTAGAEILQSSGDDSGIAPDDFDGIDIFADQLFAAHVGAGLQQSELESWGIS